MSILLVLHLFAVIIAPLADPPPSSDLARALATQVRPYLKAFALDNGYRFFAPDPGPSHLIRYEVDLADGTMQEGLFPNTKEHFPRLRYHRHFMLSEMLFGLAAPTMELPANAELSPPDRDAIEESRAVAVALQRSVANYLLRQHPDASRVRLFTVVHAIPSPMEMQRGLRLDDRSLFQERLLGEFDRQAP